MRKYQCLFVILCLSIRGVPCFSGNDAWTDSNNHFSYTQTTKISHESVENGGIQYIFSLGQPRYPFDSQTGSCLIGSLSYSPKNQRAASSVAGKVEYDSKHWPSSDVNMSMSGSLIPPEGEDGSPPTWSGSAKLQSPFWLTASPNTIVKVGTEVTVMANGEPTESTWTIRDEDWKDHRQSNSLPYKVPFIKLNRDMLDKMKWTPNPVPEGYLFPPVGEYRVSAKTTEETSRTANIIAYVVDLDYVQFRKDAMVYWKEVDENYKKIAAFTGTRCGFTADILPSTLPTSEQIIEWTGPISGTALIVSGPLITGTETAKFKDISKTANIITIAAPTGLSDVEYAAQHPIDSAVAAYNNLIGTGTLEPFSWASAQYPGIQHNTKADAARHAYWNCLLVRYISHAYANGIATGHENGSTVETETVMDLLNNSIGRGLASHTHGADNTCCRNAVIAAVASGDLWYFDDSYGATDTTGKALLQPTNKP